MSFVHLHLHTEFSLLDGACRIKHLPQYVKSLGQSAVAITDHGVMYGAIDFYKACKKEDIKPIIGCEVYVAPRSMDDKIYGVDNFSNHLILLCRDMEGYRNLSYMVSCAFTKGFYVKPRIDLELLKSHSKGLIALSACLKGSVPQKLLNGYYKEALEEATMMQSIFGEDGYYLEIQDHGLDLQRQALTGLVRLHKETGIPLVATNDAHYLRKEDSELQDVLMCVSMGKSVNDPQRLKFGCTEFYVKSQEEMEELFPDYPEAISNTQKIADLCNLEFEFGVYHLPEFPLPPEFEDSTKYLTLLCEQGFEKRYPNPSQEYKDRLTLELDMITQMGFVDYFLIVSDFIAFARQQDIPVGPGRGSAAGSMVSYCLWITDVDPMEYSLYFERFLNPERISMPDIDIDFCTQRRGEVIEYVNQKYGCDHVAQIVTFGTLGAKSALRDIGRVMDLPYSQVDLLAKLVPNTVHITLETALKESKGLKEQYDMDPTVKKLIDTAISLEGMPRNTSTHAAGVVVTKHPVSNYVPLAKNDAAIVTQYVMTTLEELGLLKMDFLALRNLTVLHDAQILIQAQDPTFHLDNIPQNDPATMQMLAEGRTSGVFQVESAGMTGVCIDLKPKDIEDITAIIALYRPGPMDSIPRFVSCKHNPENITYKHPMLEPILSVTYGCIVYQEQVIEIFRQLGGYSLGQADMMRRAISKKKGSEIEKERHSFIHGDPSRNISGCVALNISVETAEGIFSEIFDFANYAFNKAHAVCYAIVAYQTAWMKCHHPKEYMAALLTSVLHFSEKVTEYIKECKNMGIRILPPDINQSGAHFLPDPDGIRFGLVAISGLGHSVVQRLLEERNEHGLFQDFMDFCQRLQGTELNKRAVEGLIRSGCFDSMNYVRAQLMHSYSSILDQIATQKRDNVEGQIDLFSNEETNTPLELELPDLPEFTPQELMAMEKDTTGLYLNGHPLDAYSVHATRLKSVAIGRLLADAHSEHPQYKDKEHITISGIILNSRTFMTKKNTPMAYLTLEDDTSSLEIVVFSRTLNQFASILYNGNVLAVMGELSLRDEKDPQILANSFIPLEVIEVPLECQPFLGKILYLQLPEEHSPVSEKVIQLLKLFSGSNNTAMIYFTDSHKLVKCNLDLTQKLVNELTQRLDSEQVKVLTPMEIAQLPSPYTGKRLYLNVPSANHPLAQEVRELLRLHVGEEKAIICYADTKQLDGRMVHISRALLFQLTQRLGIQNVVLQ